MNHDIVVSIQALSLVFGDQVLLRNVTLQAVTGQRIAILGQSGSGKTTLLRAIAGLQRPAGGVIEVLRESPKTLYGSGRLQFLHQRPTLWDHLTVKENVELAACLSKADRPSLSPLALLEDLGLKESSDKYPFEISEGMRARVALARIFIRTPELILADEPFAALDHERREQLNHKFMDMAEQAGATILMVTHDVVEALRFSTLIWRFHPASRSILELKLPGNGEGLDPNALPPSYLALRDQLLADVRIGE